MFKDLPDFVKLAIPGLVMVCAEWWAFEILAIFAGWMSINALGAHTIVIQASSLCYMIPWGLSSAVSTRVGNALGAGDAEGGHRAVKVALMIVIPLELLQALLVFLLRRQIGAFYSKSEEVINQVAAVIPVVCVMLFGDGIVAVSNGILRGMARQNLGAIVNVAVYYLFGLPMAWALGIPASLGVVGLWIAASIASWGQGVAFQIFILFKANWEQEAEAAVERVRKESATLVGGGVDLRGDNDVEMDFKGLLNGPIDDDDDEDEDGDEKTSLVKLEINTGLKDADDLKVIDLDDS